MQPETLLPDRSYAFFSHTHKAQPENMPLLDKVYYLPLSFRLSFRFINTQSLYNNVYLGPLFLKCFDLDIDFTARYLRGE